jgi:hypothetical protein
LKYFKAGPHCFEQIQSYTGYALKLFKVCTVSFETFQSDPVCFETVSKHAVGVPWALWSCSEMCTSNTCGFWIQTAGNIEFPKAVTSMFAEIVLWRMLVRVRFH